MKVGRFNVRWIVPAIILIAVVITCSIVIGLKSYKNPPIEISFIPPEPLEGNIFVHGEVNSPGLYPLRAGDSVEDIVRSAGGVTDNDSLERIEIIINGSDIETPQKININKAEVWLLEALPGIGDVRAQAIVQYRRENGLFHDIRELSKVPGLGETIIEDIQHLITVGDY